MNSWVLLKSIELSRQTIGGKRRVGSKQSEIRFLSFILRQTHTHTHTLWRIWLTSKCFNGFLRIAFASGSYCYLYVSTTGLAGRSSWPFPFYFFSLSASLPQCLCAVFEKVSIKKGKKQENDNEGAAHTHMLSWKNCLSCRNINFRDHYRCAPENRKKRAGRGGGR